MSALEQNQFARMRASCLSRCGFRNLRGFHSLRSAFTLLEVVMALSLFAIAIGVLSGSIYTGLRAYHVAQSDVVEENAYRLVLRQVLAIQTLADFENGGTVHLPDGIEARWETTVQEAAQLDLFAVQVRVRLSEPRSSASAELEEGGPFARSPVQSERAFDLYLYRPDWSQPVDRAKLLEDRRSDLQKRREARR